MPTYDYECQKCRHGFELFQKMSDKPGGVCPKCGSKRVKRQIGTGAGMIFKGSGFYITDYRSEGYKKAAKADSSGSSSSPSTPAAAPAKAESKPAAKATKKAD